MISLTTDVAWVDPATNMMEQMAFIKTILAFEDDYIRHPLSFHAADPQEFNTKLMAVFPVNIYTKIYVVPDNARNIVTPILMKTSDQGSPNRN